MTNWTEELFIKNPDLFLGALEDKVEQAPQEVDKLLSRLSGADFEPRKVMDLACGIGRHSLELAKKEIKVQGVDISKKYIQIAKKQARKKGLEKDLSFKVGDMREIADLYPEGEFDGILNLFTSFGYYDEETDKDILKQCRSLVKEGGFFVLEIQNRDWVVKNFDDKNYQIFKDWVILEQREFDFENSRVYNTWRFFKKNKGQYKKAEELKIDHRLWSLHELIKLFEQTGWEVRGQYPGFGVEEPEKLGQAKKLMLVAVKKS